MIGIIAAVSANGVIGVGNSIPWSYPEDMKHFRKTTTDSTVIMGRRTFESMNCKPLPKRRNIVITSQSLNIEGIETFPSIKECISVIDEPIPTVAFLDKDGNPISYPTKPIWLIGGASIYEAGMKFADKIVLTVLPDVIEEPNAVRFPWINPTIFVHKNTTLLNETDETKPALPVFTFVRR